VSDRATRLELRGGVATITLDRPEERNALSGALMTSLGEHLDKVANDPSCRVVVLTNSGPAFCAGADLKGGGEPPRFSLGELLQMITGLEKPVVGRIAGHAMGGGVGLAAACDISVVAKDARLGFSEVRVGVAPAIISVVCLPKLRVADALELFLTGQQISADRAVELGLVNRAVDRADLDSTVNELIEVLLQGAPKAQAAAKGLVRQVPEMPRKDAFTFAATLSGELFSSEEAREGRAAFFEKRPASWVPRPGETP
jgi:methylglutaconyl-CoA hydratase